MFWTVSCTTNMGQTLSGRDPLVGERKKKKKADQTDEWVWHARVAHNISLFTLF